MIYKVIIGLLVWATLIYYVFCFLEIFEIIKFTGKNTTVKIPQMFIPFYYLIKKDKEVVEEPEPKRRVKKITKPNHEKPVDGSSTKRK